MTATRRAWLMAAIAGAGALVALGLAALLQWTSLEQVTRDSVMQAAREQAVLLGLLVLLLAAGAAAFAAWLVRSYEVPLRRLAAAVEAEAPELQVGPAGPPGVRQVATVVGSLAAEHAAIRAELDDRIALARGDLEAEHARLAALMADLAVPVLVCTAEGQILLYNDAAHDLLDDGAGAVGLGRSVFGVVDRDLVAHALERFPAAGERATAVTTSRHGRLLRVRVAPVPGDDAYAGFVLTLEDMTTRAEQGVRRDAAVRELTRGTRAAAGAIRAAAETTLDYPDIDPADQRRFAELIRDEADRLGTLLERIAPDIEANLADRWLLDEVRGDVLVSAAARSASAEVDSTTPGHVADLWLRADSFAVAQLVGRLADRVRHDRDGSDLRVALTPIDDYAALDLCWAGAPVGSGELRAWQSEGLTPGPYELAERHGGEIWAGVDRGTSYVRLLLPRVPGSPTTDQATSRRTTKRSGAAIASRPQFYDFGLLDATPLPAEWEDRRLAEVAYTVFDTETTGLDPAVDGVVAIGAVRVVRNRLLSAEVFERLVDPGRSIPRVAAAVHGITDAIVAGQPRLEQVLPDLARFAADTVIVGHDVAFDLAFVERAPAESGPWPTTPVLDTLLLSAVVDPEADTHSLDTLAARFGVDVIGRHTALGDALLTAQVFLRLLPLLETRGITTVGAAVTASTQTPQARRRDSIYRHA